MKVLFLFLWSESVCEVRGELLGLREPPQANRADVVSMGMVWNIFLLALYRRWLVGGICPVWHNVRVRSGVLGDHVLLQRRGVRASLAAVLAGQVCYDIVRSYLALHNLICYVGNSSLRIRGSGLELLGAENVHVVYVSARSLVSGEAAAAFSTLETLYKYD